MSIRAKKSLGQHFLRSKTALTKMIDAASLSPHDSVLEIGPGEGVLTEELLARAGKVVAVETDDRCIRLLEERFAPELKKGKLTLIEGDVRDTDTHKKIFARETLGEKHYKLIANIPYYITGMLFRMFLEQLRQPTQIVFLVQKEVAEQITAKNSKEGILSLSIKAFGVPHYIGKVKKEAFSPPPKVDSAIISVTDIHQLRLPGTLQREYFLLIKAGLGSRRKMLHGNLIRAFPSRENKITEAFDELEIDRKIRGEDLGFEKWLSLTKLVSDEQSE